MAQPTYDTYLENEILHADPMRLVCILYRAALDATAAARVNLRDGKIRERARCVSKASGIVTELLHSLDPAVSPDIHGTLAPLYVYIEERLAEGNAQQTDAPFVEVERLLATLLEGWTQAAATLPAAAPAAEPDAAYAPLSLSY